MRVPSSMRRDCEVSSSQMLTARASRSPVLILLIHRSRLWGAACSDWALGGGRRLPSARSLDPPSPRMGCSSVAGQQAR